MAETRPPRQARAIIAKGGQAPHMPAARAAPVKMGGGAGAGGGGGLAGAFGGGAARGGDDPAVSGNFERNPITTMYGFPIAGGGLTEHGKEQEALQQRLQGYNQQIQSSIQQGATFQEAFRSLARSTPAALNDLMSHPTALQSMASLSQVLGGNNGPTYGNVDPKTGQQISFDPNTGEAIGAKKVPGYEPAEKPANNKLVPITTKINPDGSQSISYSSFNPATGLLTPTLGPNGEQAEGVKAGKGTPGGLAQADIAGLPPQVTSDVPKTQFNRLNENVLNTTPTVLAALGRLQTAASAMGPIKGPLAALSGSYFGLNGTGAQFKADLDLLRTQAPLIMGSGYKSAIEAFMTGIGSTSEAPSFIKLQAGQMMTAVRQRGQSLADEETLGHQGKLPATTAHNLIDVGIVPNGYQNQKTLDGMPPGQAALWKMRFAPDALSHVDKAQLATDAAHGKFGPPGQGNTDPDFQAFVGIREKDRAADAAKTQQGTASTAAQAAQPAPANSVAARRPDLAAANAAAEGAGTAVPPEAGAQQPQQPTQQGQQQPQPGQPTEQQQPNGQQGQAGDQQQGVQAQVPPINPLMPPTAIPGQPAQGVPATNATTPQPPASPLPLKTSQMLTPQGDVPTPAVQAPVKGNAPTTEQPAQDPLAGVATGF